MRFPEGSLPAINEALTVEANGQRYTMEVEQHLENKTVRCVMMAGSDGLARGLTVTATKAKDDWRCVTAIRKYI